MTLKGLAAIREICSYDFMSFRRVAPRPLENRFFSLCLTMAQKAAPWVQMQGAEGRENGLNT